MMGKEIGQGATSRCCDLYRRLFAEEYYLAHYNCVQFFVEQLLEFSHAFDADLQSVVVLAIVGQKEIEARIRSQLDNSGLTPADTPVESPARINISSIAEISGIPRETVRRKVEALAQHGWIERDVNGFWRVKLDGPDGRPARQELIDIDRRQMERVCQFLGQMHALTVEAQTRREIDPAGKPCPAD